MNRIIKKFVMFVLPFLFLFINVSYAEEFLPLDNITVNINYTPSRGQRPSSVIDDYTFQKIYNIVNNYYKGTVSQSDYDNLINAIINNGYDYTFVLSSYNSSDNYIPYIFKGFDVTSYNNSYEYMCFKSNSSENIWYNPDNPNGYGSTITNLEVCFRQRINGSLTVVDSSVPVKRLTPVNNNTVYWDGETYSYKVESDSPDTPSLPSNAEIASAVQLFYNTIYNQPNISFDDFIVLYDNSTGLYSYIGHTRGNAIGQVIVEPNGYYNGCKFDTQWWQFFLDEQNDSWEWENLTKYNNYFLYSSEGTIDSLKYVGKDKISNLFTAGPWATSNTIIVYSTNDYPVKYITFSEESPDPIVETGTIKGDQYTYDENIDITDNQYNPLDNFVSVDYPSSLVSRADFDKFMETFNENKDFLILPSDSKWIIIACESLFGYFSSFIIMCAVFIIVERIMRG